MRDAGDDFGVVVPRRDIGQPAVVVDEVFFGDDSHGLGFGVGQVHIAEQGVADGATLSRGGVGGPIDRVGVQFHNRAAVGAGPFGGGGFEAFQYRDVV